MIGPLLFLLLFPACKNPAPHPLSQQADSLLQVVDSLHKKIISANLDSIQDLYTKISSEQVFLMKNLEQFAALDLNRDRYLQLDSVTRVIGLCLDACNDFYSEISVSENHLEMIAEEIAEREIPDSTLKVKIVRESALLDDLTKRVMFRMELMQTQLRTYRNIQPDIEHYVEQLNKKQSGE